jgi:phosphatidylserine/phosphatidylglycerophosphate/cardiolipin synthase-like enzyme
MIDPEQPPSPILKPGRNCWQIAPAHRIAFLVDGKSYFDALAESLVLAQRRVVIIGWDFDSRISLRPEDPGFPPLADFLRGIVEQRPDLDLYLLVWRTSLLLGANAEIPSLVGSDWWEHPRIHFEFDGAHPIGAAHHQKIVCIDDTLAFVGGMDITQGRWDLPGHPPDVPHRIGLQGEAYTPTHDVQIAVEGAAAAVVSEIAADRWRMATGTALEPLPRVIRSCWPKSVRVDLRNHPVAIARTQPRLNDRPEVREIEQLNLDCLGAARERLYLEAQYFALPPVADILAEKLARPDGPEVIILATQRSFGVVEQLVMGENRDRLFSMLRGADRWRRLRLFHVRTGAAEPDEVKIHSKLVTLDHRFLRIGSSNLNNRSMGVDTECDIAIEAETPAAAAAIRRLEERLLSEHLGVSRAVLRAAQRRFPSLVEAVDAANRRSRRLVPFEVAAAETAELLLGSALLDPSRPFDIGDIFGQQGG